jgi:hypothetical protein
MAGSAVGPLTQLSFQKGLLAAGQFAKPLAPMLLSYIFGLSCALIRVYRSRVLDLTVLVHAAVYAEHFPERRWPGAFDYFGASHQIWHGSIVAAICFNFFGESDQVCFVRQRGQLIFPLVRAAILELFRTKDTCVAASAPLLPSLRPLLASAWRVLGQLWP